VDYDLFKECFNIIKLKKHLTEEGLIQIILIKSALNKGLSDKLKEQFDVTGFFFYFCLYKQK